MTFLLIVSLSYLLGCVSTIAILIYLYICYGLYSPRKIAEQEQYQAFHPLPQGEHAKNSTVDTINYIFQFLFQEMKDTPRVRRYIMKKLQIEFDDIKQTKAGKLFLQNISIQSFSMGSECPILSDIQLERHERDQRGDRHLIKEVVAKLNIDYRNGFNIVLDITLKFGYKCQLTVKVKRILGHLRLEFRREPFTHWLIVFQDEPLVDFEIKSQFSSRESPQLAQLISQQIRRAIRRKQTWPSYKIRYQPFFPTSKQLLSTEILSPYETNLIPGRFDITLKYCDRLSIPFEIFHKDQCSLLSILLTVNINEEMCADYLQINREQWKKKYFEFRPKSNKMIIKEVLYMNRTEFLIDEFDPIPNEIEDREAFKVVLEDKNVFLLQIKGQPVKTLKQINRLINGNEELLQILVGMPVLHSTRVQRRLTEDSDQSIQQPDSDFMKPRNSSADKITLIMMNDELLAGFQAQLTATRQAEPYIEFDDRFEFKVGPNQRFLNVCLWCKPPPDCDIPNVAKKLVLLGYATISLAEIVRDAHLIFKPETQITLNFRPVYSDNRIDSENKKLIELSTHKGYDDNMTHGFVTINIKHQPGTEIKDRSIFLETILVEKEDDRLTSIHEEHDSVSLKLTDHIFEDHTFSVETFCAYCSSRIWWKVGRQCRNCSSTVHNKCEEKFNNENSCTPGSIDSKSIISEDEISMLSTDDINSRTTTPRFSTRAAAASAFSTLDSKARRSFRRFKNRDVNPTSNLTHETDENSSLDSSLHLEKPLISNPPIQTSSKLASAASSAYSKFRGFKTKHSLHSPTLKSRKTRSPADLTANENISETDLQDIITRCLSDDNIDIKGLEDLFHEKAVDHTDVYTKGNQFGSELFEDSTVEERKEKLEETIYRLQQEIDLQRQIRDEMIIEYNNDQPSENRKRQIAAKMTNIDEKIQALASLTIFYCSSLKNSCSQLESKNDNHSTDSKIFDENSDDNEQ